MDNEAEIKEILKDVSKLVDILSDFSEFDLGSDAYKIVEKLKYKKIIIEA